MNLAAVIVAAGRGARMAAAAAEPKQYLELAGKPILRRTLEAILAVPDITSVQVVIHRDDEDLYETATCGMSDRLSRPVFGGTTRQASVLAGLEALAETCPDLVLIHDAARPFITTADVTAIVQAAERHGAAIAATPVVDTLKRQHEPGEQALIDRTVPRDGLWRALTPQAFRFREILELHRACVDKDAATDDAALFERAGRPVALVPTSPGNYKITTPEDLAMASDRLGAGDGTIPDIRTGTGFDVHRFAPGTSLWLCGVEIPHTAMLDGHSDADVGLHALTDAIFGLLSDGDIGSHFPPSDPQWKGAASDQFLAHAGALLRERGGRLLNVDVTLLCEAPKIGPHRETMRNRIAEILDLDVSRVGVKATTTERLGFTGRKEGIAAMATATAFLGFL